MYITENNNGDVYESHWIASSVVVVTRFGQYRFSYFGQDSQQTFSPSGICTDFRGNILVCNGIRGFRPNCSSVHLLDRDGHFLSGLIPPEACPMGPSALIIDDRHSAVVGGQHSHVLMVSQYLQTAPDILRALIDSLLVIH
uniref:Uncharacterized protein LOC111101959 n=1 Tax=Crassostrea virginica TaxID=6565 RepID=A0A8B8AG31_CRAVI|nr:uncharacterized protein LOC111101959 [Crassostrea virginica]